MTLANITTTINSIRMLNSSNFKSWQGSSNFKSWQENLLIVLRVIYLDFAIRVDSPTPLMDKSTSNGKRDMERWEKSNCMCMMIINNAIPEAFRGTISEKIITAKKFFADIEKRFVKNEKAEIGTLLISLILMRYRGKGNLVHLVLISLLV